eukprot:6813390-Pyramimonas_sp.AAC.2
MLPLIAVVLAHAVRACLGNNEGTIRRAAQSTMTLGCQINHLQHPRNDQSQGKLESEEKNRCESAHLLELRQVTVVSLERAIGGVRCRPGERVHHVVVPAVRGVGTDSLPSLLVLGKCGKITLNGVEGQTCVRGADREVRPGQGAAIDNKGQLVHHVLLLVSLRYNVPGLQHVVISERAVAGSAMERREARSNDLHLLAVQLI